MYVREITACLLSGMLTPAIRAIYLAPLLNFAPTAGARQIKDRVTKKQARRPSTLALLMPWLGGANDPQHTVAANLFAVPAELLHRCSNFHHPPL